MPNTTVRTFAQQKGALTRAVKTSDYSTVRAECLRAVAEWESREGQFSYGWPDDWSRWDRALSDVGGWQAEGLDEILGR